MSSSIITGVSFATRFVVGCLMVVALSATLLVATIAIIIVGLFAGAILEPLNVTLGWVLCVGVWIALFSLLARRVRITF